MAEIIGQYVVGVLIVGFLLLALVAIFGGKRPK